MKKLGYMFLFAGALTLHTGKRAYAGVNVSVNISAQPLWGPVGYDVVEYYYLPEMEMYYYVPAHKYVYLNSGRWVFASRPPFWYSHYDMYATYKVVINRPRPYLYFHTHRIKYGRYKSYHNRQAIIRNSRNPKYFAVKGHPHYGRHTKGGITSAGGNNWKHHKNNGINHHGRGVKHYPNHASQNNNQSNGFHKQHSKHAGRKFNRQPKQGFKQADHGGRGKHKGGR